MPIQTDLSQKPYNSTVPAASDYYWMLTQPGVSLQSREIIEMQQMFGRQIERFGDNIFTPGTIVSGCNFLFLNPYPYVKLLDQDAFGNPVVPSAYVNSAIINPVTGLRAQVSDYADGFVSTDPNLKTLYLSYYNTGFDSNTTQFSAGDTLTVYDPIRNGVETVVVGQGGLGFANGSPVFAVSALAVKVSSGSIANGQYIVNGLGANVQVIAVDSLTLANSGQVILSVMPRAGDLANSQLSSSAWTMSNGQSFTNSGNTATGTVAGVIGYGYQGITVTDSTGAITQVLTLNKGFGYTSDPFVTLQSANNGAGYTSLNLTAQNYVAKLVVASTANAVGNAYAFGVNEGVVYLEGAFLRVAPQTVVVSKYDTDPDGVSVVFTATETIVTADVDPTLNDPAAGDNNGAPGADRLKIVPNLSVVNTASADANSQVVALVEWNEGNAYIQRQPTQYSTVGSAIAQAVSDTSGDFYLDPFLVTTASTLANDSPYTPYYTFDMVVDAGSAYIGGYKVQTSSSFVINTPFQFNSVIQPYNLSLNYGNYVVVTNLGGTFQYNTGDLVQLYNTAKGFASNSALVKAGNTNPVGTNIGNARIRNLQLASGVPGTATAQYNLYLFDVNMTAGGAFADVMSVYYNGTNKGVADVVLSADSTGAEVASLNSSGSSNLLWSTGFASVKNCNAASYQFTALDQAATIANSGVLTKSLASSQQTFPWVGTSLSAGQLAQVYMVPTTVDLVSSTNAAGSWVSNAAAANLVANTGTAGLTNFVAGDWVYLLGNTSQVDLKQVQQVVNNTLLVLDSAPAFANGAAVLTRCFPKNLPIPLGTRAGCSANVSSNGTVLSVNIGFPIQQTTSEPVTIGVPVQLTGVTPATKTVNRQGYVKICTANNAGGLLGPWCLGVPDAFRLRSVFVGNSSVSNTGTDYSSLFSVDNNQNPDFLDLSWLYLDSGSTSPLTSNSYVLVEFDYYSTTGSGYYVTPSYTQTANVFQTLIQDHQPLANLSSAASTWEVPEFFTDSGIEVDLLSTVDFRPSALATATPGSNSVNAPLNPSNVTSFSTTEKMFPQPGTVFNSVLEYFVPRIDTVYLTANGDIDSIQGQPLTGTATSTMNPAGTMKIADVLLPEYPNLPATRSVSLTQVINTGIVNSRYSTSRTNRHSITLLNTITQDAAKNYTNQDIASLEQRISNLEYYVNLNQLESSVSTLVIPSASDPSVNRYQFGFFADDFTTQTLMDLQNPGYSAMVENGDVVPSKLTWEVFMGNEFSGAQAYTTQSIVSQLNATIGTAGDPTATPQCAVSLANTIAFQTVFRTAYDYNDTAPSDGTVDVVNLTLADSTHMAGAASSSNAAGIDSASANNLGSGTVTLWFYAYNNPVQFQVLQGNTVVVDSSQAVALSASDVTNLTTGTALNQWFNDQTNLYLQNPVVTSGAFVEYAGKITWNYSGSGSQNLTVRTTNGAGVRDWRWVLSYPINGDTAGCVPPPPPPTCPSGYTYDASSGGCVLNAPVLGPPINVDFNGCGNDLREVANMIAAVENGGNAVGTITLNLMVADGVGITLTGSLSDFLNPFSSQNEQLVDYKDAIQDGIDPSNLYGVQSDLGSGAVGGSLANQLANLGLNPTQAGGYYTGGYGQPIYYVSPSGQSTLIPSTNPYQLINEEAAWGF